MGYHIMLNISILSQPKLNRRFYQGMVTIILVGEAILSVKTAAIAVSPTKKAGRVYFAIAVSTGFYWY